MMGQGLFEDISRQYREYGITALEELTQLIPQPEDLERDDVAPEAVAAIETSLAEAPDDALTFDEDSAMWIRGAEDDIERMLADREEFVAALEAGEDPGV